MQPITRMPHGRLMLTLLLLAVLARWEPAAAFGSAGTARAPDQPDFPPAVVRCDPSVAEGQTSSPVSVDLYLEDTQNTYGIDVQVTFDVTKARVIDQNSVIPGTQIAPLYSWFLPGFIITNVACNPGDPAGLGCSTPSDVGTIWYSATQFNPTPPVSGSGPFARVTFQPLSAGVFSMHFFYHKLSDPAGTEVPSTAQDCTIRFLLPTAVEFADVGAEVEDGAVMVHWETVSEVRHFGYNVLRADAPEGPWRRLNGTLIPATAPDPLSGGAYSWLDREIEIGTTYFYVVETVDIDGVTSRSDPIQVTGSGPNAIGLSSFTGTAQPSWTRFLWAVLGSLAIVYFAMQRRRG